jgi:hypothetical protein
VRKIELTEWHLKQIELMAGWGLTEPKIARALGISLDTLQRRKKDTAAVSAAIARGLAIAESHVGQALLRKCMEGDVGAIKYWENTRADRVERKVQETIHRHYRDAITEVRQGLRLVG